MSTTSSSADAVAAEENLLDVLNQPGDAP